MREDMDSMVTFSHHEPHTISSEDTLLHGKPIFVLTARDLEDISLELIAKVAAINLS